eukprot:4577050-Amphidinium_carterae.1
MISPGKLDSFETHSNCTKMIEQTNQNEHKSSQARSFNDALGTLSSVHFRSEGFCVTPFKAMGEHTSHNERYTMPLSVRRWLRPTCVYASGSCL